MRDSHAKCMRHDRSVIGKILKQLKTEPWIPNQDERQVITILTAVQFSSISSAGLREEKSVKGQPEKMSVVPCSKLTATDGREAKVKRQWVPDNWSCDEEAPPSKPSCSGSWNEQITALGWVETRTAWTVSDCAGNMLWSMVSKVAKRSRRQRHDNFCDPMALMRWSWIYSRAVSVEWYFAACRFTTRHDTCVIKCGCLSASSSAFYPL